MSFKSITRIGDLEASHDGCPESRLVEGDHRITIFGQPVGRIGDHYEAHSSSQEDEHRDYIKEGINAVKAWGIPIATVDSLVSTDGHGEDTHVLTGEDRCSVSTDWSRENGYENGFKANRERIESFPITGKEELILCMPDICDNMATLSLTETSAQGWLYLRAMFVKWLSGRASNIAESNENAFIIDIEWARKANSFEEKLQEIQNNILNDAAKRLLAKRLSDNLLITNTTTKFDFINENDDYKWRERATNQHQSRSISLFDELKNVDLGLIVALRGCSIYGLAKGSVQLMGDGRHRVNVETTGAILWDKFAFSVNSSWDRMPFSLGVWSCERKTFEPYVGGMLDDDDFNDFREKYDCGSDFIVTSNVHIFDSEVTGEFVYEDYVEN